MKINQNYLLALCVCGLSSADSLAQGFSSGSDGSYGSINVTSNTTLAIPTNGIFNCTTITVASGFTLTFTKNALNTPVYLLATGDVNITGTIDVSGKFGGGVAGGDSGPGGYGGGTPGSVSVPPGAGYGPGAGLGGNADTTSAGAGGAAYARTNGYPSTNKGAIYGNALLVPLVGGSGGGGTVGTPGVGGGGG